MFLRGDWWPYFAFCCVFIERILCLWINVPIHSDYNPPFEAVGNFFGIWHEHKRGNHHGLHEFYFEGNYILLLNINPDVTNSNYRRLMPANTKTFSKDFFNKNAILSAKSSQIKSKVYRAKVSGVDCNHVCGEHGKKCSVSGLELANTCDVLKQYYPCVECEGSIGADQPAYVHEDAPPSSLPRHCLFNHDLRMVPITCEGSHPDTMRLCVCE